MLYRVLRSIIFLTECGIESSESNIRRDCGRSARRAIEAALRSDMIALGPMGYVLTEVGEEALSTASETPYYPDDITFRDEVLSGLTASGDRVVLEGTPVLPTGSGHYCQDPDGQMVSGIDVFLDIEESINAVSTRYNYSIDKTMNLLEQNRLAYCADCQDWGVFRNTASGSLRKKCTICEGRKRGG